MGTSTPGRKRRQAPPSVASSSHFDHETPRAVLLGLDPSISATPHIAGMLATAVLFVETDARLLRQMLGSSPSKTWTGQRPAKMRTAVPSPASRQENWSGGRPVNPGWPA